MSCRRERSSNHTTFLSCHEETADSIETFPSPRKEVDREDSHIFESNPSKSTSSEVEEALRAQRHPHQRRLHQAYQLRRVLRHGARRQHPQRRRSSQHLHQCRREAQQSPGTRRGSPANTEEAGLLDILVNSTGEPFTWINRGEEERPYILERGIPNG